MENSIIFYFEIYNPYTIILNIKISIVQPPKLSILAINNPYTIIHIIDSCNNIYDIK